MASPNKISPEKAADKKDNPRREILRAAAELFKDMGYSATSIDAIAKHLGATKGHIYYWYSAKADIYLDVQQLAIQRLVDAVEPLTQLRINPREKITCMAKAHVQVLLNHFAEQKVVVQGLEEQVILATGVRHSRKMREIIKLRDDYEQLFCEVISQGISEGVFVDEHPRLLTKPFFGALNWLTIWYQPRRQQTEDDLQALAELLTGSAVRGLLNEAHHE